jgi:chaperone protein PapD
VKLFYRPELLIDKRVSDPPSNLQYVINGTSLTLKNPTGFFISLVGVEIKGNDKSHQIFQHVMLAPFSSLTQSIPEWATKINKPKVKITIVNDSGAQREIG